MSKEAYFGKERTFADIAFVHPKGSGIYKKDRQTSRLIFYIGLSALATGLVYAISRIIS